MQISSVSTQFNALCYYPPALNSIPGKRLNRVLSKLLKQDRFRFVFPLNKLVDGFYNRSTLSLRCDSRLTWAIRSLIGT